MEPRRLLAAVAGGDPDDQIAEARLVGTGVTADAIADPTDVDLFAVAVQAGEALAFDIDSPDGELDSVLRLFDASGTPLAVSDDDPGPDEPGDTFESFLRYPFAAGGTYYVGVSGYENAAYDAVTGGGDADGSTGGYTLSITRTAGIRPDRFEPNDTLAAATTLGTLGDRVEGDLSLHAPGNGDFYRFTAAASGVMEFAVSFAHAEGDVDVRLLDAAGTEVALSEGTADAEAVSHAVTGGQTYFLHVYGHAGATSPDYDLTISGPDDPPPGTNELYVSGTGWTQSFRDELAEEGMGDAALGLMVPAGAAPPAALPWSNINRISVRFAADAAVREGDLAVRSGTGIAYGLAPGGFTYDAATHVATWTLDRPLADYSAARRRTADRLVLEVAGAAPDRRLDVIPGDVNCNGAATPQDFSIARAAFARSAADEGSDAARAYTVFKDVNANGSITTQDLGIIRGNLGGSITLVPQPPPAQGAASMTGALFGQARIL